MTVRDVATGTSESSSILIKAFHLLRSFRRDRRMMSLTELSRASGLPKSTVHRLLERLVDLDAVERHPEGYCVSLRLSGLGALTPAAHGRDTALPHLAWLHRASRRTVRYGVLRTLDVVYLERMTRAPQEEFSAAGSRLPAHCTAIGKALLAWEDRDTLRATLREEPLRALTPRSISSPAALLAELDRIAVDGLAHEHDEARIGWSCVAAPVLVRDHAVAAVSVQYPSGPPADRVVLDAVRVTATRIGQAFTAALVDETHERYLPYSVV